MSSVFWSGPRSKIRFYYKTDRHSNLDLTRIVYTNISGKLSNIREYIVGNNPKQGQCDLSVAEISLYYKLKEIST